MKKSFLILSLATMAAGASAMITDSHFPVTSPTSEGHWVKIDVMKTGMHQITDSELTEMGFANPSQVCIYGRGGFQLNEQFCLENGDATWAGGLEQIPTIYQDGKLIFYAEGLEKITFTSDNKFSIGGYFKKESFNIYSKKGNYFLTDNGAPLRLEEASFDPDAPSYTMTQCVDYEYAEEDLEFNPQNSGQIFWGRTFDFDNNTETVRLNLEGADTGVPGVAQCIVYTNDYALGIPLTFGFPEGGSTIDTKYYSQMVYSFVPVPNAFGEVTIPSATPDFKITFDVLNNGGKGYLDYWLLSYRKAIPALTEKSQSRGVLANVKSGETVNFSVAAEGAMVWDVTVPQRPVALLSESSLFTINAKEDNPNLVFFLSSSSLTGIDGWSHMNNQDLHAQAAKGAEFLIITLPQFLPQAEQIANLHRKHDGIMVMVATTPDIYNEYSAGKPDPMAYKWLIKSLSLNKEHPLRNVLLFGKITSDIRGMNTGDRRPEDYIIAYQEKSVNRLSGAQNSNDFLVMMQDYTTNATHNRNFDIGIGFLPVNNDNEADICVQKIDNYLNEKEFAWFNNNTMWWACPGDEHMHDISAKETMDILESTMDHSLIVNPIPTTAFPTVEEARHRYFDQIEQGNLINFYFGHGDPVALASSFSLLYPNHLLSLHNKRLPFMIFAGCSMTNCDRGQSGIGEKSILNIPHAFIGALLSSRETYNNENKRFISTFFRCMNLENPSGTKRVSRNKTIGEVYARYKSELTAVNELAYHLMCDPALIIPIPTLTIKCNLPESAKAGETLQLTGEIHDHNNNLEDSFSGELVGRLMLPAVTLKTGNFIGGENTDFYYTQGNQEANIITGKVENGKFSVSLYLPHDFIPDEDATIAFSAYDVENQLSAASRLPIRISGISDVERPEDSRAPKVVDMYFTNDPKMIHATVEDETALNFSYSDFDPAVSMQLDGSPLSPTAFNITSIENDGKTANYRINLPRLTDGTHCATLHVKDRAGNRSSHELVFDTQDFSAPYRISFISNPSYTHADILIEGGDTDEIAVKVTDIAGNTVFTTPIIGDAWRWDYNDINGNRVPTGLYKIHISGPQGYSEPLNLPVI